MVDALESWRQNSLFVDNILMDIFAVAEPLFGFVDQQLRLKQESEAPPFSKYQVSFLRDLSQVRTLPATALCYQTLAKTRDLPVLVQSLQQAQVNLAKAGRAESREKVEEMKARVEKAMEEV